MEFLLPNSNEDSSDSISKNLKVSSYFEMLTSFTFIARRSGGSSSIAAHVTTYGSMGH